MKRSVLERAVSRATGESRRTIRRYGFQLVSDHAPTEVAPHLELACPGCGGSVTLPRTSPALPEFAECPRCEAAYPYQPDEVYLPDNPKPAVAACA